jgi:hypothetical protein
MTHQLDGEPSSRNTASQKRTMTVYFENKRDVVSYVDDLLTAYAHSETLQSITITPLVPSEAYYVTHATTSFSDTP